MIGKVLTLLYELLLLLVKMSAPDNINELVRRLRQLNFYVTMNIFEL